MKIGRLLVMNVGFLLCAASVFGQELVVIHDPVAEMKEAPKVELSAVERNIMNRVALPKVRKKLAGEEFCKEEFDPSAVLHGSFSRAGTNQTVIFYQYCQTGNGLGQVGLVLIEGTKMLGNFIADVGWSVGGRLVPDLNRNGLDEFALYYSGGIHQGNGGVGVDLMEFDPTGPRGVGWFQAENFTDDGDDYSYKVWAKLGRRPIFYRQKFVSDNSGKFRRVGAQTTFRMSQAVGKFAAVR
jgi:hypothetical protein